MNPDNFSNWKFKILAAFFLIGLIYILLPGPGSINSFSPLPNSLKSDLEGDTIQNPNIAAYFSDFTRDNITTYYKNQFENMLIPGFNFPTIKLNHPPELARQMVRDQQESTFLEEYIFPLRESIFVNGYEPKIENEMYKKPSDYWGNRIQYKGNYYLSKTTLRFYPSNILLRTLVYFGIWFSFLCIFKIFKKAL